MRRWSISVLAWPVLAAVVALLAQPAVSQQPLRVGPDGKYIPQLAAEVPDQKNGGVSPDGKTITYHLRPGVLWSDGQPMTCDDVKFTWQVLTTPKSGAIYTSGYDQIQSVDCPNPQTAVV